VLTRVTLIHCARCAAAAAFVSGCGNGFGSGPSDELRSRLESLGLSAETTYQEAAANDLLELAEPIEFHDALEVIGGSIGAPDDVDVFDFGPVQEGDRVLVSLSAAESLKSAIAIFDESGSALLVNDHQNVYLGIQGPFVDVIFRRPSRQCFVAVTSTPGFNTRGDYVLGASIDAGAAIPDPRADTILLDFEGGVGIRVGTRPAVDVPVFDAADIGSSYDGATESLTREIVRRVREDFAGLNVTILSTSEGDQPSESVSRVHFGAVDNALLGVAEGVDEYNAMRGQRAIVYTESFAAFSRLSPSVAEMSQAIANVASHEIGHLLGLVHTQDASDIMDVTASLNQLLRDQTFGKSPIYRIVFPIGYQDSAQLLFDSVGGDPIEFYGFLKHREWVRARAMFDPDEPPARASSTLSSCGCGGGEAKR